MILRKRSVMYKHDYPYCRNQFIFLMAVCLWLSLNGNYCRTQCAKTDNNTATFNLVCSNNQMINVTRELYGKRTSEVNCSVVEHNSINELVTDGLSANCTRRTNCTETIACIKSCNGSGHAFEITYECVKGTASTITITTSKQLSSTNKTAKGPPSTTKPNDLSTAPTTLEEKITTKEPSTSTEQILSDTSPPTHETGTEQPSTTPEKASTMTSNEPSTTTMITSSDTTTSIHITRTEQPSTTPEKASTMTSNEPSTTTMITSSDTTTSIHITRTEQPSTTPEKASTMTSQEPSTTTMITSSDTTTPTHKTRTKFIFISVGISGGVLLLIIFIIITFCVYSKIKSSKKTTEKKCDVHTANGEIDELKIFSLPHNANPNFTNTKLRASCFGLREFPRDNSEPMTHTTFHTKEDRTFHKALQNRYTTQFEERKSSLVVNGRAHETGRVTNDQECETIYNHLHHSFGSHGDYRSTPVQVKHLHPEVTSVDDETQGIDNVYHILEAPADGVDDEEAMMVDNDLYHSYRKSGYTETQRDDYRVEDDEEAMMVDNDLYHTYRKSGYTETQRDDYRVEDDEEALMVDNDLYHTYRKSGYTETQADEYRLEDKDEIMVDNDLYHRYVSRGHLETQADE